MGVYLYPIFLTHFPLICTEIPPALHWGYRQFCRHTWSSFLFLRTVYQIFLIVMVNTLAHFLLLSSSGNVFSSKWTAAWVRQWLHLLPPKPGCPQEFLPGGLICASPVWHTGRSQFGTRNAITVWFGSLKQVGNPLLKPNVQMPGFLVNASDSCWEGLTRKILCPSELKSARAIKCVLMRKPEVPKFEVD